MSEDYYDAAVEAAAAELLDPTDLAMLAEVAVMLDAMDPVPDDLAERVQFSLALDEMYAEVAHLTRLSTDAMAVRSDSTAEVRTESLTFSAKRLTAMVTVSRPQPGQLRVDGWIAPPSVFRVQLRMQDETRQVLADEAGRFVFEDVPEGFAQLSFHPNDEGEDDAVVVTPLFQL